MFVAVDCRRRLAKNSVAICWDRLGLNRGANVEHQEKSRVLSRKRRLTKKSDSQGLFLFVTPSGAKLWRLAYRFGGKQKELSLGQYPEITLAKAREKQDDARRLIANGTDPGAAKQEAKRAAAALRPLG